MKKEIVMNKEKILFIIVFFLLFVYVFFMFLFGENLYICVYDNLDLNIMWYKVLYWSGELFGFSYVVLF